MWVSDYGGLREFSFSVFGLLVLTNGCSALEIVTSLCDPEFYRKAKAADFFGKTWDVFVEAGAGRGDDKVSKKSLRRRHSQISFQHIRSSISFYVPSQL